MNLSNSQFTPPRHWIGPEELEPSYWNDVHTQEKRAQEFFDKPIETISKIDQSDKSGLARREFLTLMGASMAMAGLSCARRPVHKIIPYVVQPEEITPGVANWYASTHPETGLGVLIKTREGRPIKLEGNPDHLLSRGALPGRVQASVLDLYDQDRLKEPLAHPRSGVGKTSGDWKQIDASILARLKKVGRGKMRILSRPMIGDSTRRLAGEFLSTFGSGAQSLVEYEPLNHDEVSKSQAECYGSSVFPQYDFTKAEFVLSLSSDFLGTGDASIQNAADWSKGRKLKSKNVSHAKLSKLVCFESVFSVTGANADERFPIRPGDELKIALALAHELIVNQKKSRFTLDSRVVSALSSYSPEKVAAEIGISGGAHSLNHLAQGLWESRGKSLVIGGGVSAKTENALALQIAVNLLNSALENEGVTVDGVARARVNSASGFAGLTGLISEMISGQVDAIIIHGVNPVYDLPKSFGFLSALNRVQTVIVVSEREDETAKLADYVLPEHHFLENWGDAHLQKEFYSLQQPAIAPLHSTRGFEDTLISLAKGSGQGVSGLLSRASSWHDYLKTNWQETIYKNYGISGNFEQFWEGVLRQGVFDGYSARGGLARVSARAFNTDSLSHVPVFQPLQTGIYLALYSKISMHDGSQANNPWLQEMPDPISTVTWDNYLNLSPALAGKLGVEKNDVIRLSNGESSVDVPVIIQPGMHASAVSLSLGYGRTAAGKIGNGVGVNAYAFVQSIKGQEVFSGFSVSVAKTGKFYKLGETQWHHASENRPIINDITLDEFKSNPATANHTDPHLRMETVPTMWPVHEYKGARWGMAIDLNSCTGCGACVIACQAENNIPVVWRDNVRVSREMQWMRIDWY